MKTDIDFDKAFGAVGNPPIVEGSDQEFFQRYQMLTAIGTGTTGDVFFAVQRGAKEFKRLVVVKQIHTHLWQSTDDVALFLKKVNFLSGLNHPRIVNIIELTKTDTSIYIAMEYIDGETLKYIFSGCNKHQFHIPFPISCKLMLTACEALRFIHAEASKNASQPKAVHHNIGLHNLMIDRGGNLKMLDYGLIQPTSDTDSVSNELIKGNPEYMAPDFFNYGDADSRADVYALGLCFYELLTLTRAFKFDHKADIHQIIREITTREFAPPSKLAKEIPSDVDALVLKAIDKDRLKRFQTADAFYRDLKSIFTKHGDQYGEQDVKLWFNVQFEERVTKRQHFENRLYEISKKSDPPRESEMPQAPRATVTSAPPKDTVWGTGNNIPSAYPDAASSAPVSLSPIAAAAAQVNASDIPSPLIETGRPVIGVKPRHILLLSGTLFAVFAICIASVYFLIQGGFIETPFSKTVAPKAEVQDNLFVYSVPEDADLFLNGQLVGRTGKSGRTLKVAPHQKHTIELRKDGYRDYQIVLVGPADGRENVTANLQELPSPTPVVESPPDAIVPPPQAETKARSSSVPAGRSFLRKRRPVRRSRNLSEVQEDPGIESKPSQTWPAWPTDLLPPNENQTDRRIRAETESSDVPMLGEQPESKVPLVGGN
ncbi:MAG: serine/threonine-protein kinase [Myxococcota bacterium]|nr:serine/threonine-protein kinase [Myxococcota bacterium]